MYTKKTTKDGRTMYRHKNRLVKFSDIPPTAMIQDLDIETVDLPQAESATVEPTGLPQTERSCIFCGGPAEAQKFVNLRLVDLCEEDYRSKTTGEVAQQLRETQTV